MPASYCEYTPCVVAISLCMKRSLIDRALLKLVSPDSLGGLKSFLRHLSGMAPFFVMARVFTVLAGIIAARVLTKSEFGSANLAVTVGFMFAGFATLGYGPAVVRYGVRAKTPGRIVSTGLWVSIFSSFTLAVVALICYRTGARLCNVSEDLFVTGILCGCLFTLFALIAAAQQALSRFILRGVMEISLAIGYLVIMLSLVWFGWRGWETLVFAWILAYVLALIIGTRPIVRECAYGYSPRLARHMLPYALPNLGCAIGFFLMSSLQRLQLNAFMTGADVAMYTVYYAASVNMATFLWGMVSTVFFNKAAATNNREKLWNMTARAAWLGAVPMYAVLFCATACYILLCGRQYHIEWTLVALFAAAAALTAIASAIGQVIGAHGVSAMRLALVMSLTIGTITAGITWLLLTMGYGIYSTPWAIMVAYAVNIVWLYSVRKRFF